ncbi:TadE-like protein [Desulfonatronum thiosulfatophilum]|uniref:TadE-like protein n=1 Tax=Desulfonatronum thiosulfatophilum TaxID=617002 RepID=A0A1G6C855_9BACT|nr:TadE family protein [Desulfonatronum thiosulfatophilum]SDB29041.1 TadE-like protein [Desulfonatronum thiosulfatophilum]
MLLKFLKRKKNKKHECGATAVEFALIISVFLLVMFIIMEAGIYMFNRHVLTWATREGARTGIVSRIDRVSEEMIKERVNEFAKYIVTFNPNRDPISVDIDNLSTGTKICSEFGDKLQVESRFYYNYGLPVNFIPPFSLAKSDFKIRIVTKSTMICE